MDFSKIKKVYVIGIKGSGVVAVAEIFNKMGIEVTGSDTHEKFFTDEVLKKLGIKYAEGFSIENIPADADLIMYAASYNEENNVEVAEAKKRGLNPVYYPSILGELFNQKYGIAVCGTHGKTTTSSMLAFVLDRVGVSPTAVIGSRVRQWGGNAIVGTGEIFVIEADEYQNKLALYKPQGIILTSVDYDHPDFFKTVAEYEKVFAEFVAKIPKIGFLVAWGDSAAVNKVAENCCGFVIKYGFLEDNDVIVSKSKVSLKKFSLKFRENDWGEFETQLAGDHNLLNAAAVIVACHELHVDMEEVRKALKDFQGTSRRFEMIGQRNGAILIDDYGHHPEEIKTTLKATREMYPSKNIIAVFHPHSYSRTEALLQDFAQSFDAADQVIVLDIYGSARENFGKVSSKDLVDLINKYNRDKAEHIPTIDTVIESLQDKIGNNDIVLAIGAGNVFEVAHQLKQ